jgi:hypothetical protein
MCMCGKPTRNGEPGYSWNGEPPHIRPVQPPDLKDGDELLYDEPGRCGGLDSHSHHLRVVKGRFHYALLVRHGGGDERIDLGSTRMAFDALAALDSDARYWLLLRLYHVQSDAARHARDASDAQWRQAAAEKRIKTRKQRGRGSVKVWIEPAVTPARIRG